MPKKCLAYVVTKTGVCLFPDVMCVSYVCLLSFLVCVLFLFTHYGKKSKYCVRAMNACRGSRGISPLILNLVTTWRWMVFRLFRLLLWSVVPRILLNSLELSSSCTGRLYTNKFYVSSTQSICVFCTDLKEASIISPYFID